MKITRKKRKGYRIEHNRKLFWIIVILIIAWIALISFIVKENRKIEIIEQECKVDEDCLPSCGCHPDSCVAASERGECPNVFCTQECSGPLDCNAGSCGCIQGKCSIVENE
tara:strand:- start:1763 stop:2095 length:333 start_codon:yes stop_codon:yes gene_type:complete